MEKYKAALETMCKRCENYEVCQGTGCGPKKELADAIQLLKSQKEIIEQNEDNVELVVYVLTGLKESHEEVVKKNDNDEASWNRASAYGLALKIVKEEFLGISEEEEKAVQNE